MFFIEALITQLGRHGEASAGLRDGRPRADRRHPADNFLCAYEFFRVMAGTYPEMVAENALGQRSWSSARTSLVAPYNRAMLARDRAGWRVYLRQRLSSRGWNADSCLINVPTLPSAVPQSHRWQLFRLHLNGIYTTSAQVGVAGVVSNPSPCYFCRFATDSVAHLVACPVVQRAWRQALTAGPAERPHRTYSMDDLFFQTPSDGHDRALVLAFFCATLSARRQIQQSPGRPPANVELLILQVLRRPWVSCSLPTLSRQERRDARLKEPLPAIGRVLYRAGGYAPRKALASNGSAGWGAARWSPEGRACEAARGRLDVATSANVARYHGLLECMPKAWQRRSQERRVIFELDSEIVVRQVRPFGAGKYACRSDALEPLFLRCAQLGRDLEDAGVHWNIRHIYAEYNATAKVLAKQGAYTGPMDWCDNC